MRTKKEMGTGGERLADRFLLTAKQRFKARACCVATGTLAKRQPTPASLTYTFVVVVVSCLFYNILSNPTRCRLLPRESGVR